MEVNSSLQRYLEAFTGEFLPCMYVYVCTIPCTCTVTITPSNTNSPDDGFSVLRECKRCSDCCWGNIVHLINRASAQRNSQKGIIALAHGNVRGTPTYLLKNGI